MLHAQCCSGRRLRKARGDPAGGKRRGMQAGLKAGVGSGL